jgi:hypothetical protein
MSLCEGRSLDAHISPTVNGTNSTKTPFSEKRLKPSNFMVAPIVFSATVLLIPVCVLIMIFSLFWCSPEGLRVD